MRGISERVQAEMEKRIQYTIDDPRFNMKLQEDPFKSFLETQAVDEFGQKKAITPAIKRNAIQQRRMQL